MGLGATELLDEPSSEDTAAAADKAAMAAAAEADFFSELEAELARKLEEAKRTALAHAGGVAEITQ